MSDPVKETNGVPAVEAHPPVAAVEPAAPAVTTTEAPAAVPAEAPKVEANTAAAAAPPTPAAAPKQKLTDRVIAKIKGLLNKEKKTTTA
ncbi:unnamed protein product [Zymoseptoria tritici ST99CH_1A5]|uniref:Uncharacterized protein n=3 Tax=Zymoseptoria tritici TaxID=1047171 RepID=A0A1X7RKZ3_ZYMT9|nr:unnamed protein product [Zymoseptoria tritici ST99CH_3D7]SMR46638.1 unnamed protein product [Zymoseptoria tritici ST99CH_1E4]SMR47881.1 unnamed protein product [Zymoseptoria tritici ST99CH_3D1]SMY21787.1 unnamed protein product [Zymoseptoria tritici ST99CH_1A5]